MKVPKFEIFTVFLLVFALVGYLEGSWTGLVAAPLLYLAASTLLPLSLIPIGGTLFYLWTMDEILQILLKFINIGTTGNIITASFGIASIAITIVTVIIIVIITVLYFKYGYKPKALKSIFNIDFNWIDLFKGKNVQQIIDDIIGKLQSLFESFDKKLLGSFGFWLGVGIASHDFWWEASETDSETSRPTQGTYTGLEIATLGMNVITWDLSVADKIKQSLYFYAGLFLAFLGFVTTGFLPKGPARIISHIFWWSGIGLMVYNWYVLMSPSITEQYKLKGHKV